MASWEEIKKLAADLHRVQLGEGSKKLSERNCIEVVANLIERCFIDVVFSLDGKEYITKDYLRTQIINETLANDGRISLVDLQQILNVQYQNIENEAKHIAENRNDFTLCLGQLISRSYFEKIFREIDEKLQECGRLTLSDITKCYDLPTELLISEITRQLGQKIRASFDSMDSSVLYTNSYIELQEAIIRGALTAVTKPIQIGKLISEVDIEPGLFFNSFDHLINSGHIKGTLSGGKIMERSVYIPDVYVESTERFIKNFYYQNGYIELSTVKKLAQTDAKAFLRKLFSETEADSLKYLKNVALNREAFEQMENFAEEAVKQHNWVDIKNAVSIPLESDDLNELVDAIHKKHEKEWHLCDDCTFYHHNLVDKCLKILEPLCAQKASKESVNVSKLTQQSKEQHLNNAVDNAKRVKGAKGKKKGAAQNEIGSESQNANGFEGLTFMTHGEIVNCLNEKFQDNEEAYSAEILNDVASKIYDSLNSIYRKQLETIYIASESVTFKKNHNEFNDKFLLLYQNICLFETSTSIFGETISEQLRVHLLRTLCTDLVNLAVGFYCHVPNSAQLTPKIRDKTIEALSDPVKSSFQKLVQSLNSKDLYSFFDSVDEISAPKICSLNAKRPDKKVRVEIANRYKAELVSQLLQCNDESTGLLLCCLLLLSKYYGPEIMVHASGKFVPQFVVSLQDKVSKSIHSLLIENQRLVVQKFKSTDDQSVCADLKSKFDLLKNEVLDLFGDSTASSI